MKNIIALSIVAFSVMLYVICLTVIAANSHHHLKQINEIDTTRIYRYMPMDTDTIIGKELSYNDCQREIKELDRQLKEIDNKYLPQMAKVANECFIYDVFPFRIDRQKQKEYIILKEEWIKATDPIEEKKNLYEEIAMAIGEELGLPANVRYRIIDQLTDHRAAINGKLKYARVIIERT